LPGFCTRKKISKNTFMITGTINAWATSLGVEARTILRALAKTGIVRRKTKGRIKFTAKQITDALFGDEQQERLRNLKLDADKKHREEEEAKGQLITLTEVESLLTERVISPLRERLLNQGTRIDALCNPSHPQLAREAITADTDETLKLMREKLK